MMIQGSKKLSKRALTCCKRGYVARGGETRYLASRLINVGSINSINCANLKLVIDLLGVEFCTKRASGIEVIATFVSLAESTQPHVILY